MPEYSLFIHSDSMSETIMAGCENSLLEIARSHGFNIDAPCGGKGKCRGCRVTVNGPVKDPSGNVHDAVNEELIACCHYPAGDLDIHIKESRGNKIQLDAVAITPEPSADGETSYGLAIDIGTTTIAVYLYDLSSGKCRASLGEMNSQRPYGADVISRIVYSSEENGLETLTGNVRDQLMRMAKAVCPDISRIKKISIAGNTVMEHLFAGLSPKTIGVAPFTPLSYFGNEIPASDIFEGFAPDTKIYLCPAVSGYIGGDITAGILSSGLFASEETMLFIDIGTNGEMCIGNKDKLYCCSTAAGPAFEGAGIECGAPAAEGSISSVSDDLSYEVIGGTEPTSICGSAVIDAISALLKNEFIDETGAMDEDRYYFTDNVWISDKDVRKIQLAKSAIRAGIETLLQISGKTYDDVSKVLIAGGFGAYLKPSSACGIGLLPPAFIDKTFHIGNSAGRGAALALNEPAREQLSAIKEKCIYEELSGSAIFNTHYLNYMGFYEDDD